VNSENIRWVRVTGCENIPVREGKAVEVAGRRIAIFNLGDAFLAVDDQCPHRGGPLSDGIVSGSTVVCPLHAWAFDLATGSVANHPESQACVATFPLRVEQGEIFVGVPQEEPAAVSRPKPCDLRDRPVRWVLRKNPQAENTPRDLPLNSL
jgi:nitrite reductase (NADH) small subunit